MLILKAQNVVSEGIPIVYVYQMHQQNGSFAQNVDSEDIPGSTNGVNRKARNNKLDGDRAPPTSTNVLIYKMGWPPRLQFLAPFHISCIPDINKVDNRSYMGFLSMHRQLLKRQGFKIHIFVQFGRWCRKYLLSLSFSALALCQMLIWWPSGHFS